MHQSVYVLVTELVAPVAAYMYYLCGTLCEYTTSYIAPYIKYTSYLISIIFMYATVPLMLYCLTAVVLYVICLEIIDLIEIFYARLRQYQLW